MNTPFIFMLMIFLHIVDDYYLQGLLKNIKQIAWWKENAPQELYKNDYVVALLMHSFSWAFMIMLPIALQMSFKVNTLFVVIFVLNILIHGVTDHAKANLLKINLITDQSIHIIQIIVTIMLLI